MTEARLTHVDESGAARMVDVSEKAVTTRVATVSSTWVRRSLTAGLLR